MPVETFAKTKIETPSQVQKKTPKEVKDDQRLEKAKAIVSIKYEKNLPNN